MIWPPKKPHLILPGDPEFTPPGRCDLHTGLLMASAGQVVPVTGALTASAVDPANSTTYNDTPFQGLSLGAAGTKKMVLAISGMGQTRTVSSCSIDGEACSQVHTVPSTSPDAEDRVDLWQVETVTAETGTVSVTFSGAQSRCGIKVYRLEGAAAAAHDTGGSTANPMTDTLDVPAGGFAIAHAVTTGTGITFTVAGLTENTEETVEAANFQVGGSDAFAAEQSGLTVTVTPAGTSPTLFAMVMASWGPA